MKIALIGQEIPALLSSLLADLLFAGHEAAEICAEEKNETMSSLLEAYADRIIRHSGVDARFRACSALEDTLRGADAVVYAGDYMASSRFQQDREALGGDENDPEGLSDQARVNGGLGGLMHTLRQGEKIRQLCDDMDGLCPKALVITLGEPVARTVELFSLRGYRCYGLGKGIAKGPGGVEDICRRLGLDARKAAAHAAGLPGFEFLLSLTGEDGQEQLDRVTELARRGELGRLCARWLERYGAVAVGRVTEHAEFLPAQPDYAPEERPALTESVERRKERILWMNTVGQQGLDTQEAKMAQVWLLSRAPAARPMQLALALLRGEDLEMPTVARKNRGEIVSLPREAVIQSDLTLKGGAEQPHGVRLPPELADVCAEIDEAGRLAARAAFGDRSALRECIELDPALEGLDRLYLREVVDKLIDMHSDILTLFGDGE